MNAPQNVESTTAEKLPAPIEQIVQGFTSLEEQLKTALPAHIPVERFTRVCITAIQMSHYLLQADRKSLFLACMKCAQDGLLPDGRDAALVPFKDGKRSKELGRTVWSVQYMPMVGGILKKVRNSGELKTISAQVVYENDKFFYRLGDDEKIEHEPLLDGDRGKPHLVYAVAHTKDGGIYREVLTIADVNKIRNVSRAKDDGPWVSWWEEMARKTAIRRLSKRLPSSGDLDDLIRRDDSLYDLEGASDANTHARIARPQAVKGALDHFAGEGATIDQTPQIAGPAAAQDEAAEAPQEEPEDLSPLTADDMALLATKDEPEVYSEGGYEDWAKSKIAHADNTDLLQSWIISDQQKSMQEKCGVTKPVLDALRADAKARVTTLRAGKR